MTQTATAPVTHRSHSQARQYRTCGHQYFLERIERAPSRPNAAAVAGVAVHVGTEEVDRRILDGWTNRDVLVEGGSIYALGALDAGVEKYADKGWEVSSFKHYGKQDVAWFREKGVPQSIEAYVDWRLSKPEWELAEVPGFGPAIEVPFNYYVSGELIHGFIDRVFMVNGEYIPLDIKSGTKPKTDEQLGTYAQALRKALGWNITWGYYIYGLKSGTASITPPLNLSHWTDEKLSSVYVPISLGINSGIFIPNPGDGCFHCSVSDSCDYTQALV